MLQSSRAEGNFVYGNYGPVSVSAGASSEDVSACSSWDVENKVIGTIGAGRIGQRVLERLLVSLLSQTTLDHPRECCSVSFACICNSLHSASTPVV